MTIRWWVVQILGIFLFLAGLREGWVHFVLEHDITFISYLIIVFFLYGIGASFINSWSQVEYATENCALLGFLGTVIALLMALSNIDPETLGDFEQLPKTFTNFSVWLGTAFSTTIVGLVCGLWLYFVKNFGMQK